MPHGSCAENPRLWVVDHLHADVSRALTACCWAGSQFQSQHCRLDADVTQDIRTEALYCLGAVFYINSTQVAFRGAPLGYHLNSSLLNDIQFDFLYSPSSLLLRPGKLIGIELCQGAGRMDHSRHEETFESGWSDDLDPADDDEDKRFCSVMEQFGAAHMFEE